MSVFVHTDAGQARRHTEVYSRTWTYRGLTVIESKRQAWCHSILVGSSCRESREEVRERRTRVLLIARSVEHATRNTHKARVPILEITSKRFSENSPWAPSGVPFRTCPLRTRCTLVIHSRAPLGSILPPHCCTKVTLAPYFGSSIAARPRFDPALPPRGRAVRGDTRGLGGYHEGEPDSCAPEAVRGAPRGEPRQA